MAVFSIVPPVEDDHRSFLLMMLSCLVSEHLTTYRMDLTGHTSNPKQVIRPVY